eukprot:7264138-Prymnesium_polylepis.1
MVRRAGRSASFAQQTAWDATSPPSVAPRRRRTAARPRSHPRIVVFPKSSSLCLRYGGQRRPAGP